MKSMQVAMKPSKISLWLEQKFTEIQLLFFSNIAALKFSYFCLFVCSLFRFQGRLTPQQLWGAYDLKL